MNVSKVVCHILHKLCVYIYSTQSPTTVYIYISGFLRGCEYVCYKRWKFKNIFLQNIILIFIIIVYIIHL